MDDTLMGELKGILKEFDAARVGDAVDYHRMTAPCGLPCFACGLYLANSHDRLREIVSEILGIPSEKAVCKGCRNEEGKCGHLPMECRLYPCAAERGVEFCHQCLDFPCDYLHPYADRADEVWHNTKVFNLCLMKKMGLDAWARDKAGSVRDVYYWGNWTL
jgi:hypothetical protein